jgi:hypothetical protein
MAVNATVIPTFTITVPDEYDGMSHENAETIPVLSLLSFGEYSSGGSSVIRTIPKLVRSNP